MKTLEFSHNWNRKLDCGSFSTVRLFNPSKYVLLDLYSISLNDKQVHETIFKGVARLQSISNFQLDKVSPAISFLDSNLPVIDFIKLVKTMYKNKKINFNTQKMSFLVFQYLTETEIEELNL
jgi:hypothetical protein